MNNCPHNNRTRYEHGYTCEDCLAFFEKSSETYHRTEYLFELWMALHNLNATALQRDHRYSAVVAMCNKIGIGKQHPNYEEIITEAENLLAQFGTSVEDSIIILSDNQPT